MLFFRKLLFAYVSCYPKLCVWYKSKTNSADSALYISELFGMSLFGFGVLKVLGVVTEAKT